jgi:hypothetical protein
MYAHILMWILSLGVRRWKSLEHAGAVDKNRQIARSEWKVLNKGITRCYVLPFLYRRVVIVSANARI